MNTKRNTIYALKGLAIISVVYAHCNNRVSYNEIDALLDNLRSSFGAVGVPFFFLLSGYLFHNQKRFTEFCKSKIGIVLPWLFWGTIVWGYEVLRKGLDYASLGEWLLGIGNYLWYMRTLVIFWLIYYWIRSNKIKMLLLGAFTLLRIAVYDFHAFSFIESQTILDEFVCQVPFFALGIVMQKVDFKSWYDKLSKILLCVMSIVGVFTILWINDFQIDDAKRGFLIYIGGLVVFAYEVLTHFFKKGIGKTLIYLGKNSFCIYLIHMPVAGIISNIFSRSKYTLYFVPVYPLIALGLTCIGVFLLNKLFGKQKWICKLCALEMK